MSDSPADSCRLCQDDHRPADLVSPCNCRGSVGGCHFDCLVTWIEKREAADCDRRRCEICSSNYRLVVNRQMPGRWNTLVPMIAEWHVPVVGRLVFGLIFGLLSLIGVWLIAACWYQTVCRWISLPFTWLATAAFVFIIWELKTIVDETRRGQVQVKYRVNGDDGRVREFVRCKDLLNNRDVF